MDRLKGKGTARGWLVVAAALTAGCPSPPKDSPPPAESLTLASAAPGALGALAAGTDAAPPVGALPHQGGPGDFDPEETEPNSPDPAPDAGDEGHQQLPSQEPREEVPL